MEESFKQLPLRILITTDTVGGVWSYCMELCKALQSFNVHFYLVTSGAPMLPAQKAEAESLKNVAVYETGFLLEWMESPWQSIDASGNWLLQLEAELKPHLIHLNGYAYGALPWKAPVVVAAHSDVFSWWRSVKGGQPPTAWNEYFQRVRNGLHGADFIIAPSQTMLHFIQGIYNVSKPAQVIYNGRSTDDFYPAKKEPYVFSMGRIWDEAKNIRLLTGAAPLIHYPIRLAGETGFEKNSCNATGTNVTYLGKLPMHEVAAQLSAASVYVLPAKYEPFGLSVLEAALSGCALVLGNIDSLREIWRDSAVYIDTENAEALAETINNLMHNKTVRMQYAQKAQERAKQYTTTAMAKKYVQMYQRLLQPQKQTETVAMH